MHHEFQPLFSIKGEITGERNDSTDAFIGTSVNRTPTVKYSFATVLINKCFAIKNGCNTTRFRCMYYKK